MAKIPQNEICFPISSVENYVHVQHQRLVLGSNLPFCTLRGLCTYKTILRKPFWGLGCIVQILAGTKLNATAYQGGFVKR